MKVFVSMTEKLSCMVLSWEGLLSKDVYALKMASYGHNFYVFSFFNGFYMNITYQTST